MSDCRHARFELFYTGPDKFWAKNLLGTTIRL